GEGAAMPRSAEMPDHTLNDRQCPMAMLFMECPRLRVRCGEWGCCTLPFHEGKRHRGHKRTGKKENRPCSRQGLGGSSRVFVALSTTFKRQQPALYRWR